MDSIPVSVCVHTGSVSAPLLNLTHWAFYVPLIMRAKSADLKSVTSANSLLYIHCVTVKEGAQLCSACHLSVSVWKGREFPQQSHSALTGLRHVTLEEDAGGELLVGSGGLESAL